MKPSIIIAIIAGVSAIAVTSVGAYVYMETHKGHDKVSVVQQAAPSVAPAASPSTSSPTPAATPPPSQKTVIVEQPPAPAETTTIYKTPNNYNDSDWVWYESTTVTKVRINRHSYLWDLRYTNITKADSVRSIAPGDVFYVSVVAHNKYYPSAKYYVPTSAYGDSLPYGLNVVDCDIL